MPAKTELEKRDRGLIAFTILSGARDDAVASMKIRHVDLERRTVFHDAREGRTKNRKTHISTLFPVGDDFEEIVTDWVSFLTKDKLFGPDEPLFPATKIAVGPDGLFGAVGLDRVAWSNAGPIRHIFRQAFERADLPYFHPHSFRRTLGALGERLCRMPEDFKAWSQNLAHEGVLTTFSAYGTVLELNIVQNVDGGKYEIRRDGVVYYPIFEAAITVSQLKTLAIELANYIAQPTREDWDGKAIHRLIAA
jgi:integrase